MKEMIEAFRTEVERTEAAHLRFITMRTVEARNLLDMLEQTSRAQRTDEGEFKSAAAPAAGQAGLATIDTPEFRALEADFVRATIELSGKDHHADNAELYAARSAIVRYIDRTRFAAPVAADTEHATIDRPEFDELLTHYCIAYREDDVATGDQVFEAGHNLAVARAALITHIDSVKLAPLATPADAGAGLTDEDLTAIYNDCAIKADDWSERQAREPSNIEAKGYFMRLLLARLSTPGAPVTAEPAPTGDEHLDWQVAQWSKEVARLQDLIATATGTAPADRDAIREAQVNAIRDQALDVAAIYCDKIARDWSGVSVDGPNAADECAATIRTLKSMERAAGTKGDA